MIFQIFWDNSAKKPTKVDSIHKIIKILKENNGFNLVGPVDFNPENNCFSLQLWSEGENGKSIYLGDIYSRKEKSLNMLYRELYKNNSVEKVAV
jgi:hypothetical protein